MPKKSILEMNVLERLHNSLSSKVFHAILGFSLILSLIAISFGFFLYSTAINNQFALVAHNTAKTSSLAIENTDSLKYIDRVLEIYENLNDEQLNQKEEDNYNYFESVNDNDYKHILSILEEIEEDNEAICVYLAALDKTNNRLVYIMDTSEDGVIGYWDDYSSKKNNDIYTQKFEENLIQNSSPRLIERDQRYGYLCTSWDVIENNDRYLIMAMADLDMEKAAKTGRLFLIQYFIVIFLAVLILDIWLVQRFKKSVVKPIQDINQAARDYIADKGEGMTKKNHFGSLDIHTGDEIESLSIIIGEMEKDIGLYVDNITKMTAENERLGTELSIASQIQEGTLPNIFPPFPNKHEFDIYATMSTAKEVGGDFYDFFLVDDDHLAIVMADVSGKGVPAALFMMASKILINNLSTIGIIDPGQILEEVNKRIVVHNPAEMFVTVWLGILEISSGKLKAANAGHEYPFVLGKKNNYELLKDRHGFVIGSLEDSHYHTYEIQLEKGDSLFLYTDGVTEATNSNGELFGNDRLLDALNDNPNSTPEGLLKHVKEKIDEFVKDAAQFDDITMLTLAYYGKDSNMEELNIEATIENVPKVTEFIDRKLEEFNCPLKAQTQIDIAIDELFSNIAKYAYHPGVGPATVRVEVEEDPMAVVVTFIDNGQPYDPLKTEDPDLTLSVEEREIGGLGIYVVKKTMDEISYEYKDGQNILRIKKGFIDGK